jgi:hypothetical protein
VIYETVGIHRGGLCGNDCRPRGCADHLHPALNQICSQALESVRMIVGATEFDALHVVALRCGRLLLQDNKRPGELWVFSDLNRLR